MFISGLQSAAIKKREPESVSKLRNVVEVEFPRIAPLRFVRVIYTDVGCRCAIHLAMAAIISDEQGFDATILCFLGFQTHFREELLKFVPTAIFQVNGVFFRDAQELKRCSHVFFVSINIFKVFVLGFAVIFVIYHYSDDLLGSKHGLLRFDFSFCRLDHLLIKL